MTNNGIGLLNIIQKSEMIVALSGLECSSKNLSYVKFDYNEYSVGYSNWFSVKCLEMVLHT